MPGKVELDLNLLLVGETLEEEFELIISLALCNRLAVEFLALDCRLLEFLDLPPKAASGSINKTPSES